VVFNRGLRGFCFDSGEFIAFCIHRHTPPDKYPCRTGLKPMSAVLSELVSKPAMILLLDTDLHPASPRLRRAGGLTLFLVTKFIVFVVFYPRITQIFTDFSHHRERRAHRGQLWRGCLRRPGVFCVKLSRSELLRALDTSYTDTS
jgi:hypothetical protein